MKEKILFFGAGAYADSVWKQMEGSPIFKDEYVAFTDNNKQMWGKTFHSLKVIPPDALNKESADFFVITSIYEREIKKQMAEMGISGSQIYSFTDYKRKCYIEWLYDVKYNVAGREKPACCFNMDKTVVYTAITGGYDELKDPLFINDNFTYVCFTDDRSLKSDIWNMEYISDFSLDSMHLAKKLKLHPHLYFGEFETSIWVDGKFQICEDFGNYIAQYGKSQPILCFPHFERSCIYDEAGTCLHFHVGNKQEILRQISDYFNMGYPVDNGLYEMGCIVRNHNDELVRKVMTEWWEEIQSYSYRDQISFPVVCWKNNLLPDICNLDIYRNKWLKGYVHNFLSRGQEV